MTTQYEVLLSTIKTALDKLENITEIVDKIKECVDIFKPLLDWVRLSVINQSHCLGKIYYVQ